jgi:hypothetical protein
MEAAVREGSGSDKLSRQNSAAVLTDVATGGQCNAKLNFMSRRGMYFESECAFMSGNVVEIQFDKPPLVGAPESYSAKVYWCMLISENDPIGKYGVGVKYR